MESQIRVALLGLGTMGGGMARNLLRAGFPLAVYNRTPAKTEALASHGAFVARSPAEAASSASIVLSMLSDDDACRELWCRTDGALAAMKKSSIAVECSTVSPAWIEEISAAAHRCSVGFVEAPVTGSRLQADSGQLTFLAGADETTLAQVLPVLRAMSKEVIHLGAVGSGVQLKLINNFLCGVQVASFAEALAWIERTGLNQESALAFLKKAAPGSGILNAMADRMTQRNYDVNFLLRLMAKDLRYAQAAAAQFGIALSTGISTQQLFAQALQQGQGDKDMSAIVEVVRAAR